MPLASGLLLHGGINTRAAVFLTICGTATAILAPHARAESSVEDLRSEVRQADPPSRLPAAEDDEDSATAKREASDCDGGDSSDDSLESWAYGLAGYGALFVATSPLTVPKSLIEDGDAHLGRFSGHPYLENDGYMVFDGQLKGPADWSTRLTAEYGNSFSTKDWMAGRWLVEHSNRLGIDGTVTYLKQETGPASTDEFFYGDTNVTWRFAQNEWAQMRAGVGFNWLGDELGSDFGVNFTYGGDFFPMEPFVLSGELDIGSLNHAFLLHLRGTVGVQIHRAEVFTGYDYLQLDGSSVHGLVGGVRLWF